MYDVVTEKLFAGDLAIRRLPGEDKTVYLTFDDGPDAEFTPQVLDVLQREECTATFFVIAEKAMAQKKIVAAILSSGNNIGNHSLNHQYSVFFAGEEALNLWLEESENILQDLSGGPTVGFRPPNGVITPHLVRALERSSTPLVLWSCRFFDTLFVWDESHALRALRKLKSGDIVLLHDRQKVNRRPVFLRTLELFLREGKKQGWNFKALPKEIRKA